MAVPRQRERVNLLLHKQIERTAYDFLISGHLRHAIPKRSAPRWPRRNELVKYLEVATCSLGQCRHVGDGCQMDSAQELVEKLRCVIVSLGERCSSGTVVV